MDWIVRRGLERIPDHVSFDQACWVEPVNTCLKGVRLLDIQPGDRVAVLGQGPIGLIFASLLKQEGAAVITTDTIPFRRELSAQRGATSLNPIDLAFADSILRLTDSRGFDAVVLATSAPGLVNQALSISRPGAKILLFAQTSKTERFDLSGADICVAERVLLGSYSADVDLQQESAEIVFSGALHLEQLISHRVPLAGIQQGIDIALHPDERSLKVVVHPHSASEGEG